jgi:uncharacterized repeat protein (TIGR01451 family)
MKRLALRTSALVTLVGLGVFAIAQAQRTSNTVEEPQPLAQASTPVAAPQLLPNASESARPIVDLAKPRLGQAVRPTSLNQVASSSGGFLVTAASAAEPVLRANAAASRPTSHVVRAVGTLSEPIVMGENTSSRSGARAETDPVTRPNPLREAATPVGLTTPLTTRPEASAAPRLEPPATPTASTSPASSAQLAAASSAPPAMSTGDRLTPINDSPAPVTSSPAISPRLKLDASAPVASPSFESREPARLPASSSSRMLSTNRELAPAGDALSAGTMPLEGNGQPGTRQLEGPQTPQLTIQKFAPDGVQVGVPATFRITVVNTGAVPAHGVEVRDQVPRGMQLIETKPRASRGANGELVWELGTAKPGDELSVEVQLMPVAQGELGSVATVRFNAEASARTTATKPELALKTVAPKRVMIGEEAVLAIEVSNPGTGVATNVVLSEPVPAGLQHPAGSELEYKIGTLKPGETRQIQLALSAVRAGKVANLLTAEGDANLRAQDRVELEIVAPQIDVAMEGPKRRFLEREATYTVSVMNSGTAAAKQVELVAYLPRGLKFVSANNAGQYEPATQSVHWLLAELPANDAGKVELVTLPVEAGQHKLRFCGKAERIDTVEKEQPVTVEGIAAIMFEVADLQDPIEKGRESMYEIRVVNQGSKAATNVRITALLPAGLRAVAAEGPTRYTIEPNRVQFEGMARLAPKADTTYRIRVQGLQTGDLRTRIQLLTDEMQEPVTKEESTRVYADE